MESTTVQKQLSKLPQILLTSTLLHLPALVRTPSFIETMKQSQQQKLCVGKEGTFLLWADMTPNECYLLIERVEIEPILSGSAERASGLPASNRSQVSFRNTNSSME